MPSICVCVPGIRSPFPDNSSDQVVNCWTKTFLQEQGGSFDSSRLHSIRPNHSRGVIRTDFRQSTGLLRVTTGHRVSRADRPAGANSKGTLLERQASRALEKSNFRLAFSAAAMARTTSTRPAISLLASLRTALAAGRATLPVAGPLCSHTPSGRRRPNPCLWDQGLHPPSFPRSVTSQISYDAFGNVSNSPVATLGRWLSQDPIGFAAGDANLYR